MGRECKVLIVDDEFITRQGISHMIMWEQEGFSIVGEASNGQEGIEMIEKYQPDIVLADIVMPVLNGIEFSMILQEKYPNIKLIILSSYDNFEYVRTTLLNGAVDYVLKPTLNPEILLRALKKAAAGIPGFSLDRRESVALETQMERYLTGYQDTILETEYKERFPYMPFRILAGNMKKACGSNTRQWEKAQELMIRHLQKNGFEKLGTFYLEQEVFFCVINYKKPDEIFLIETLKEGAEKAGKVAENLFLVLSNGFTEFSGIRDIYEKEVKQALEQKFYFADKFLIEQREYITKEAERFRYEEYAELLKKHQFSQAMVLLKDYMEYLCRCRYDAYQCKNLFKNLLYNLLMEMEKCGVKSEELRRLYFKKTDKTESAKEFLLCCREITEELDAMVSECRHNEDSRIEEMKEYIKTHYKERLELADLAEEFSFNYHYISSYFNQHMQEGFSGYLNMVRIEKSCQLLKDSSMPISAVSMEVGYSDHGYYCRIFKKLKGETPSQYRRKSRTEEGNW